MGKGFQNFMSKKDFHPSAWWNLKKVWEAREQKSQKERREEELRVQYEKEQEMLNNKALLGDEKAKMGLSFMYDAPAGMTKREEPKEEPKFEWQRKYQAPREEWAKNNELIQDQPFGIQVRNVRCCRCHKYGHLNTDNECPLFGMSGNYEDAGYANNPSDLIKEYRKEKAQAGPSESKKRDRLDDEEWVDRAQLAEEMKESHGMRLKGHVLNGIREDQELQTMKPEVSEAEQMKAFLGQMTDKEKKKLMKKLMGGDPKKEKKKSKKERKKEKKSKKKKAKLGARIKREVKEEPESGSSTDSDSSASPIPDRKRANRRRHEESSEDGRPSDKHREMRRRRHDSTSSEDVPSRSRSDNHSRHKESSSKGTRHHVKQEPTSEDKEKESAERQRHHREAEKPSRSRRDSSSDTRRRREDRDRERRRHRDDSREDRDGEERGGRRHRGRSREDRERDDRRGRRRRDSSGEDRRRSPPRRSRRSRSRS